jgi:thymidine phosphorylase
MALEMLTMSSAVQQIGEAAGSVWHVLNENGSLSLAKLVERVGGNRDVVMQAVGWLAREGKIAITETKRGRVVSLRDEPI